MIKGIARIKNLVSGALSPFKYSFNKDASYGKTIPMKMAMKKTLTKQYANVIF